MQNGGRPLRRSEAAVVLSTPWATQRPVGLARLLPGDLRGTPKETRKTGQEEQKRQFAVSKRPTLWLGFLKTINLSRCFTRPDPFPAWLCGSLGSACLAGMMFDDSPVQIRKTDTDNPQPSALTSREPGSASGLIPIFVWPSKYVDPGPLKMKH